MGNRSMSDGLQALYVLYTYPRQGHLEVDFVLEQYFMRNGRRLLGTHV